MGNACWEPKSDRVIDSRDNKKKQIIEGEKPTIKPVRSALLSEGEKSLIHNNTMNQSHNRSNNDISNSKMEFEGNSSYNKSYSKVSMSAFAMALNQQPNNSTEYTNIEWGVDEEGRNLSFKPNNQIKGIDTSKIASFGGPIILHQSGSHTSNLILSQNDNSNLDRDRSKELVDSPINKRQLLCTHTI